MKGFALDERQKIRLTCCSTCSSCEPYSSTLTTSLCRDQVEDEKAFPREDFDFINGEELVGKGRIHTRTYTMAKGVLTPCANDSKFASIGHKDLSMNIQRYEIHFQREIAFIFEFL